VEIRRIQEERVEKIIQFTAGGDKKDPGKKGGEKESSL
jgi:hypothetical protein